MIVGLDHIVFGVRDLHAATQRFEALGLSVAPGGTHPATGTRNALVRTAAGYLELITVDGDGGPEDRTFGLAGLLREREGLIGFALSSDDIDEDVARLRAAGLPVLGPMALSRDRPDGVEIRWKGALVGHSLEDLWRSSLPFIIEWADPSANAFGPDPMPVHPLGEVRVAGVTVAVADVREVHDRFERGFGLSPGAASIELVPATSREGIVRVDLAVRNLEGGGPVDLEGGQIRLVAS